jgi:hypothetical protein
MHMVVCLLVRASVVEQALHHRLLVHPPLGHGRSDLSRPGVHGLHGDVVDGAFVDLGHVLHIVRDTLVDLHRSPPHLLGDCPQGGPVLGMHVTKPVHCSLGDLGSLGRGGSLCGDPGHSRGGLLLHTSQLLSMHRGLGGHGVAQGTLALAGAHDFGGDERHVRHRGV